MLKVCYHIIMEGREMRTCPTDVQGGVYADSDKENVPR